MLAKLFKLAVHYLKYNRAMSCIIFICVSISWFVPMFTFTISMLADHILRHRAETSPLVIGRKGSALQLVLNSLYFKAGTPELLQYRVYQDIVRRDIGSVVPVYNRFTAKQHPIVGTSLDYFRLRGLTVEEGTWFQLLGDVVLGSQVARKLKAGVNDTILSDTGSLYDISSMYPLRLKVAGILARSRSPDDNAIFADVKTTWVIQGIGHGHKDEESAAESELFGVDKKHVVFNPSLYEYTEITEDNIAHFHFHGDKREFPLTGIVVFPGSEKDRTILKATINLSETLQAVVPASVIQKLMDLVFTIRRLLAFYFCLVFISTLLFLVLIILLSLKIRQKERHTLEMIGGSKRTIHYLLLLEIGTLVVSSLILSIIAVCGVSWFLRQLQLI